VSREVTNQIIENPKDQLFNVNEENFQSYNERPQCGVSNFWVIFWISSKEFRIRFFPRKRVVRFSENVLTVSSSLGLPRTSYLYPPINRSNLLGPPTKLQSDIRCFFDTVCPPYNCKFDFELLHQLSLWGETSKTRIPASIFHCNNTWSFLKPKCLGENGVYFRGEVKVLTEWVISELKLEITIYSGTVLLRPATLQLRLILRSHCTWNEVV